MKRGSFIETGGFPMRRLLTVLLLAASPLPYVSAAAQTETAATALLEVPRINFTKRVLSSGATVYAIRDTSTATDSINIWRSEERRVGKEWDSTCRSRW